MNKVARNYPGKTICNKRYPGQSELASGRLGGDFAKLYM